jgi:hypothetical protein
MLQNLTWVPITWYVGHRGKGSTRIRGPWEVEPSPALVLITPSLRGLKLHRVWKISICDTQWVPIGYELLEKQIGPQLRGGTFMLIWCVPCCNASCCKTAGLYVRISAIRSDLAHGQLELGSPQWPLSDLHRLTWESWESQSQKQNPFSLLSCRVIERVDSGFRMGQIFQNKSRFFR